MLCRRCAIPQVYLKTQSAGGRTYIGVFETGHVRRSWGFNIVRSTHVAELKIFVGTERHNGIINFVADTRACVCQIDVEIICHEHPLPLRSVADL